MAFYVLFVFVIGNAYSKQKVIGIMQEAKNMLFSIHTKQIGNI